MLVFTVTCGGEEHRVEIHEDGTMHLRDHNEKTLKAFVAFDAPKPQCLAYLEMYETAPGAVIHFLLPYLEVE